MTEKQRWNIKWYALLPLDYHIHRQREEDRGTLVMRDTSHFYRKALDKIEVLLGDDQEKIDAIIAAVEEEYKDGDASA